MRLIISEEVVMQPCITVSILVLQAEGLVRRYCYVGFTLQFTPIVIIPESNQITFIIGHLSWDADLVAVEVVGLLAAFSVFCDHQRRKTQNYRLIREAPAGLFAEPSLFTLEQYRLLIIFIHP